MVVGIGDENENEEIEKLKQRLYGHFLLMMNQQLIKKQLSVMMRLLLLHKKSLVVHMAIDTRVRRFSMMNFRTPFVYPIHHPDGVIDLEDKQHLLNKYSGIAFNNNASIISARWFRISSDLY